MSCTGTAGCLCGCCAGVSVQTPQVTTNLPGQSSIGYRAGTWTTFKASMLARLASSAYPALAPLKTRDDDDFTIAFLDATATVLDILTFYQERLANESYLGTATQLRSLTELSRLIGYQPSPGVSASVYVAFTLKPAPGQPTDPSAPAITIPAGTQIQSIPVQGRMPQVFETSADIQAKADWNALPVQTGIPWAPGMGNNFIYLQGISTQLQIGDSLLILGVERETWVGNSSSSPVPGEQWDVVVLNQVQADNIRKLTFVSWDTPLIHETTAPSAFGTTAKVFAFRQKAALFGHNAPDPNLFVNANTSLPSLPSLIIGGAGGIPPWQWIGFQPGSWAPAVHFALGAAIIDSNGNVEAATTAGTSGAKPPTWPTTPKATVSDNTVVWTLEVLQPALTIGTSSNKIDLDSIYPKVVAGSWFALASHSVPNVPGYVAQLYRVQQQTTVSLAAFTLSGKVTEIRADYGQYIANTFSLRTTQVWAQSDELTIAEQPLTYPLYGGVLDLQGARPDLVGVQVVAVSGNRQKIAVADGVTALSFVPYDQSGPLALKPGDILTLTSPGPLPLNSDSSVPDWGSVTAALVLSVEDVNGRPGTVQTVPQGPPQNSLPALLGNNFNLAPSSASDPVVSEYALVKSVNSVTVPYPHTQILLQSNLMNCYDRNSAAVNANVGLATNGRSVSEILGGGSASSPNQEFTLKQPPLTYVQAPTPTGRQSTLQVQVNGAAWTAVPTLYQQPPAAQVYTTLNQSDGTTDVLFGDGVEGATVPTAQNNIRANYRTGLGSAGNVAAGAITIPIDRPLGVSGVTNPQAATGGEDPDSVDDIRTSGPQSVLTLGRAVSLADYQTYAATFAGIAKAQAIWVPSGPGRGVFLTVAGANGAALPPGNPTLGNLIASLRNYGHPLIPIAAATFLETLFGLSADLAYDPAYDQATVQAAVLTALESAYSFANRAFGQGVAADEVSAVVQAVPGVVAVNVKRLQAGPTSAAGDLASEGAYSLSLFNSWLSQQVTIERPSSGSSLQIYPYVPVVSAQGSPQPAEILVLDPNPNNVVLGVMS